MYRLFSLDANVPLGLGPGALDASLFAASPTEARRAAQEAADRLGVPVRLLWHGQKVDPSCARGWCRAPVVFEARSR